MLDAYTRKALTTAALYGTVAGLALYDLYRHAIDRAWRTGHNMGYKAHKLEVELTADSNVSPIVGGRA